MPMAVARTIALSSGVVMVSSQVCDALSSNSASSILLSVFVAGTVVALGVGDTADSSIHAGVLILCSGVVATVGIVSTIVSFAMVEAQ